MTFQELLDRTKHIPSSVYEPEQAMWLKHLAPIPGNPLLVDFGTGWGKSAVSLALTCPQATVVTFDPGDVYVRQRNVEDHAAYEAKVQEYIDQAGAENVVHLLGDSRTIDTFRVTTGREIDILNIDSDHTYETTKAEIERWVPLVKKGGIVMFHDYEHPHAPGVGIALKELVSFKDGDKDYTDEKKPFKLRFVEKAEHPKVTTVLFIKE